MSRGTAHTARRLKDGGRDAPDLPPSQERDGTLDARRDIRRRARDGAGRAPRRRSRAPESMFSVSSNVTPSSRSPSVKTFEPTEVAAKYGMLFDDADVGHIGADIDQPHDASRVVPLASTAF
jgi:hypothetical protein